MVGIQEHALHAETWERRQRDRHFMRVHLASCDLPSVPYTVRMIAASTLERRTGDAYRSPLEADLSMSLHTAILVLTPACIVHIRDGILECAA